MLIEIYTIFLYNAMRVFIPLSDFTHTLGKLLLLRDDLVESRLRGGLIRSTALVQDFRDHREVSERNTIPSPAMAIVEPAVPSLDRGKSVTTNGQQVCPLFCDDGHVHPTTPLRLYWCVALGSHPLPLRSTSGIWGRYL